MDFRDVTCYLLPMNAKLQNLFERIAALPDELLGEIEQSIDEIERWRGDVFRLTDEERAAVRKGMEAARRGEFVTDEELAAFYRRHSG
jgi:predicted transcriptional regulator